MGGPAPPLQGRDARPAMGDLTDEQLRDWLYKSIAPEGMGKET